MTPVPPAHPADEASPEARPVLRVVAGAPSDEQLAALLAVVLARTAPTAEQHRVTPGWADRSARVRRPLPTGFGAWRSGSAN